MLFSPDKRLLRHFVLNFFENKHNNSEKKSSQFGYTNSKIKYIAF
jgi:hypothetical protein